MWYERGRFDRAAVAVHWWTWVFSGWDEESKAPESQIFLWRDRRHHFRYLDFAAPVIGEREVGAEQRPRSSPKIVVVEVCIAVCAKF